MMQYASLSGLNSYTISLLTALGAVYYTVLSEPATLVISGDKYFAGATTVAISCTTQRAEIYYTLDGTSPVTNPSRIVYEDPFEITEETTVKAASCNGGLWSAVVEMEFEKGEIVVFAANNNTKEVVAPLPHTFWCHNSSPYEELDGIIQELYAIPIGNYCKEDNTPTASGNAAVTAGKDGRNHYITVSEVFDGTATVSGVYYNITDELHSETIDYSITISIRTLVTATPTIFGTPEFTTSRNVNFSCATAGATIYYTLDGSDPITSPSRMTYAGSFEVTATTTVKAAAYKQGVWSEVAEKTFTKLETPVISGDRYFTKSTSVAITCATAGATIYYTLDGELPQYKPSSRIAYDGPFMLTENTTVRAAAYLNNLWSGSVDMTFEKGVTVVFEANSNRKEMIAPLPHTFACQYSSEDGELDEVIQALYPLPYGGFCEGDAPTASGNAAVSAGKNSNDQFIYISRTFEGKATVSGIYREWDSDKIWSTKFNYSLTIYMMDDITLTDNADNSSIIGSHDDMTVNSVTLSGRKLWKDGKWNTLCLPFDVSTTSGPLSGDNVQAMVLRASDSRLEGTTLTLNFDNAPATILAGTPFIVKWQKPASYVAYNPADPEAECSDIVSPVFEGVTVSNANRDVTSSDGTVRFKGTYQSTTFKNADQSILFLGAENTLYYPQQGATIGAQRAYFDLGTAQARQFVLNFGEDNATGIISTTNFTNYTNSADVWYTIDGVRLDAQPTRKGLYIHRGRKVVVK